MFLPFKIEVEEIDSLVNKTYKDSTHNYILMSLSDYLNFNSFQEGYDKLFSSIDNRVNKKAILESVYNGSKIAAEWFPTDDLGHFDVFISHSHNDIDLVKKFAFWLKEVLGLRCFIDSLYWRSFDDLLKEIDSKFSIKGVGKFDYNRNFTTINVYMMLSMALMEMMDQTECIIFVESGNSYDNKKGTTLSPWIYEEISFINRLQRKEPKRWKTRSKELLVEEVRQFSEQQFEYNINIDDLIQLYKVNFIKAKNEHKSGGDALDYIYEQCYS